MYNIVANNNPGGCDAVGLSCRSVHGLVQTNCTISLIDWKPGPVAVFPYAHVDTFQYVTEHSMGLHCVDRAVILCAFNPTGNVSPTLSSG